MPDGRRRSREFWTDTMEAGPPSPPAHVHRLPPAVRAALAGLLAAVFLLLIAVSFIGVGLMQAREYIQGKGEQRDRENARLEEQIRQSMCDLLDQLPEGGLLDRPRAQYHCGPGIPIEQLTPQEQAQIIRPTAPRSPAPAAKPAIPPPPLGSPATPGVAPPPVAPVPPRTGPGPSAAPTPTPTPAPSPLSPVTDLVCDLAGLC